MILIVLIILILMFAGGGWAYNDGQYGPHGMGLGGILLIILIVLLLTGRL